MFVWLLLSIFSVVLADLWPQQQSTSYAAASSSSSTTSSASFPSGTCTLGDGICVSETTFARCAEYTGSPSYYPVQPCGKDLVCLPVGKSVYCVEPTPGLCVVGKVGTFTMNQGSNTPLPYVDTQFSPSPRYSCSLNSDCFYNALGPGNEVYTQDPVIEGDRRNNFLISLSGTSCRPTSLTFGMSWASTVVPSVQPKLRVRNSSGQIISELLIDVKPGKVFIGAQVTYRGPPAASFEVIQSSLTALGPRFAVDNLKFCCYVKCNVGDQVCLGSGSYATCAEYTGFPAYGPKQLCGSGTTCKSTDNKIHCV